MQNFGRGMWRRVGGYERIHVPMIHKNYELERYLALMEYNKQQRQKQNLNSYREQAYREHAMKARKDFDSNKDLLVQQNNINENLTVASKEVVSQEVVSQEVVSQEVVSQEVVSQEVVSQEVVSQEVVSQEVVSQEVVSVEEITNIVPRKIKKKNKK